MDASEKKLDKFILFISYVVIFNDFPRCSIYAVLVVGGMWIFSRLALSFLSHPYRLIYALFLFLSGKKRS